MAVVLVVAGFLTAMTFAIVATVLMGPLLWPRFGRHALWIAPVGAATAVFADIRLFGLFLSVLVGDKGYLDESFELGLAVVPWVGLAAFVCTGLSAQMRRAMLRREFCE